MKNGTLGEIGKLETCGRAKMDVLHVIFLELK